MAVATSGAARDDGSSAPVVVKLGGDVLEGAALATTAADLARVVATGQRLVVVHGGGPQATWWGGVA